MVDKLAPFGGGPTPGYFSEKPVVIINQPLDGLFGERLDITPLPFGQRREAGFEFRRESHFHVLSA